MVWCGVVWCARVPRLHIRTRTYMHIHTSTHPTQTIQTKTQAGGLKSDLKKTTALVKKLKGSLTEEKRAEILRCVGLWGLGFRVD